MRITRLEIFGFKSFIDRFVLNLDKNLVGVVGPNGCGKSNIVDSLCWVLGETHAKQLRGNLLDDIIFNGTDARRPLGMAEVSITVRPERGWQPPLSTDDTSLAAALEKVEEIDSELGEHENGVAAESANELPGFDLIPGLLQAAEIQLTRRLYRSGESEYFINRVPCRLRDMVELYRLIGLGARGLSIVQQGTIGEIVSRKPVSRRELLEEAAGISGIRARIEAAQRKLEKTGVNISRLTDIIKEVDKQVTFLRRQARRAERRNELKEEIRTAEFALFRLKAAHLLVTRRGSELVADEHAALLEKARSDVLIFSAAEQQLRAESEEIDLVLETEHQAKERLLEKLADERQRENALRLRLIGGETQLQGCALEETITQQQIAELGVEEERRKIALDQGEKRRFLLFGEKELAESKLAELRKEGDDGEIRAVAGLQEEYRGILDKVSNSRAAGEETASRRSLDAVRTIREEQNQALAKKRLAHATCAAEVQTLKRQLEALTAQVEQQAGTACSAGGTVLVASVLRVPASLEHAASAILGDKVNYAIVDDLQAIASEFEKGRSASERSLFGVVARDTRPAVSATALSPEELTAAPSAKRLLDLVQIAEPYANALEDLLGEAFLVDSLAEGVSLVAEGKRLGNRRFAVTEFGEVVTGWGWYTTRGTSPSFSFGRLLEERTAETQTLAEEIAADEKELAQLMSTEAEQASELSALLLRREVERDQLLREERRLALLLAEDQQREKEVRERILWEERSVQEDIRKLTGELAAVESAIQYERTRITEIQADRARANERRVALGHEKVRLQAELSNQAAASAGAEQGGMSRLIELQAELHLAEERLREIEPRKNSVRSELGTTLQQLADLRKLVSEYQDRLGELKLQIEKSTLELALLLEDIQRRHNQIIGEECQYPGESELEQILSVESYSVKVQELASAAEQLRRRLEREGEVDASSIELYRTEEKRLNEMTTQLADLENAHKILDQTIRRLKNISRDRFLETFHAVNEKFAVLAPRLFGGGAASLELINPEDPLGSGVDILLRPPGKKVKNLDLLSGGEKALAATAILMAMFLHRPSPLCVLDEVDAPLDEANLERFLDLIKEISSSTQFLIITHNKQTMAAVDKLIGITMEEKGVSKALSVTLEEADIDRWVANA